VLQTKHAMREWSRDRKDNCGGRRTLALVPTMGSLHAGHLALVKKAGEVADDIVVSIYVNPAQFAPTEDFGTYPRSLEKDLELLEGFPKVQSVFAPTNLYDDRPSPQTMAQTMASATNSNGSAKKGQQPMTSTSAAEVEDEDDDEGSGDAVAESMATGHQSWVTVSRLQTPLCGVSRPHFFRGVATVVAKLFHIVSPDVAVFGEKDYQQLRVIETMVRELDFGVNIVRAPIVREADGLAMSSRNALLSDDARLRARCISASLKHAQHLVVGRGEFRADVLKQCVVSAVAEAGGEIDYVAVVDAETLQDREDVASTRCIIAAAATFDGVRLIDNISLF